MLYAAVIVLFNENNEILIVKRSEAVESFTGYWCFPGGGADEGETAEECAIRETFEETSLKVKPDDLIYFYTLTKNDDKEIYFFIANKWKGEVEIDWESDEYQWIKASSLRDVKLLPTPDIMFQLLERWADNNGFKD